MVNNLKKLIEIGSSAAKNGFKNEKDVVQKFNNWCKDEDAKSWLKLMGYQIKEIENVFAVKIKGSHKTDVQVQITIYLKKTISAENLSIKLVSNPNGFNQIDKRRVDKYVDLWNIPGDIVSILKQFTGEITPKHPSKKDKRRIFLNEISIIHQQKIISFFERNKILIITDLFRGRDNFPASWMLIYQKNNNIWTLLPMAYIMNFFGTGNVQITDKGSLKIGRIGMQRKGGDRGRESAKMLQFKINPCEVVIRQNG